MVADYPGIDACNPMFDTAFHVPMTSDSFNSNMEAASHVCHRHKIHQAIIRSRLARVIDLLCETRSLE